MSTTTRVALIYGGKSGEHEVSVKTALSILENIDYSRFSCQTVFINKEGNWFIGDSYTSRPFLNEQVLTNLSLPLTDVFQFFNQEIDIVFPVIHGPNGEDGTLQGFLEMLNVPYVGCGVLASSVGMDKIMMKRIFESVGIEQCKFLSFKHFEFLASPTYIIDTVSVEIGFPCFVKPANMGSSVGISKANNQSELLSALELAFRFDSKIVIEEAVYGRELEIGVLGNDFLSTSVVGEVETSSQFYDYEAKYQNQSVTNLSIPARIPSEVAEEIAIIAKKAFYAIDGSGLSRIDFFLCDKTNRILLNEINTMPGFTMFSMYPTLFQEAGIEYPDLISRLIGLGFERHAKKNNLQISAFDTQIKEDN